LISALSADFIVSANLARRHLNKGQQALALAMMYPEGQKGKKVVALNNNFERTRLSQARAVLHHSRSLAALSPQGSGRIDVWIIVIPVANLLQRPRCTPEG
jgi:hypothetical protein